MKDILCINYSQSGQLDVIIDNFLGPLSSHNIDRVQLEPVYPYSFPWTTKNFYDPMPETVLEEPIELKSVSFAKEKYDLIILGYQPWFLSPSLPTSSLLQLPSFKSRLSETKVITIIGARNMWINAQKSVAAHIKSAGGILIGNVALVDRAPNHLSAISIVHWMMTGKKERKWGVFPKPGVSGKDITQCSKFGEVLNKAIAEDRLEDFQENSMKHGAVRIKTSILFIERKAKKIFMLWAKQIKKKETEGKNRALWIQFFRLYLNIALFGVAPILLLFYVILILPFSVGLVRRRKSEIIYGELIN